MPESGQTRSIASFVVAPENKRLQEVTQLVSVRENVDTEEYRKIDKMRYKLLSTVRYSLFKYASKTHRMSECHYGFAPNDVQPTIKHNSSIGVSSWHNLKKCENELCPVCSVQVGIHERNRLSRIMATAYADGYYCAMATLTMQHDRRYSCDDNVQAQKQAWRKLTQDKDYRKLLESYGVVGYILGTDQTFNVINGVHFHFHIIFIIDPNKFDTNDWTNDYDDMSLWSQLADKWEYFVRAVGRDCIREYAVDLRVGDQYISEYIAKKGRAPKIDRWDITAELSLKAVKRAPDDHYTLYELLILAHAGDEWASMMYAEFCDALHNQQRLSMSKFVRDLEKSLPEEEPLPEEPLPEEPLPEEPLPDFVVTFDAFRVARNTRNKRAEWLQLHEQKRFDELAMEVAQCHVQGKYEWNVPPDKRVDGKWQAVYVTDLSTDGQPVEVGRVLVFDGKVVDIIVSQPLDSGFYGCFVYPEQSKPNKELLRQLDDTNQLPAVKPSWQKRMDGM